MLEENWITISQAADLVGCTTAHLRLLAKRNELRAEKVGFVWLVDRAHAEELAEKRPNVGRPRSRKNSA